jgi:hypothetical protein
MKLLQRLEAIEQNRPDGVQTVKHMSDAQLTQIITNGQATDIRDDQLERIAKGEQWTRLKND